MSGKPVRKRAKTASALKSNPDLRLQRGRRVPPPERRQAILDAALDVFASQGFAAARLDDVAQQAGVAKGTLYLYFRDKEELFEQILKSIAGPVLSRIEALAATESIPANLLLAQILQFLQTEVLGTKRERLLRLLISEGHRFPRIAEFYHGEVVNKGREAVRTIAKRGVARGELASDALTRFPQLFFAPVMLAVVWNGLFGAFDQLDVDGMLAEHRKLLLEPRPKEAP